jgi:hypothetical protein
MAAMTRPWPSLESASTMSSFEQNSRYTLPTPMPASRAMSAMVVFIGP